MKKERIYQLIIGGLFIVIVIIVFANYDFSITKKDKNGEDEAVVDDNRIVLDTRDYLITNKYDEVPRMTTDELNDRLEDPDIIIIDIRDRGHWEESKVKIKGAIREDPYDPDSWSDKYPKDKTIITYCK